jgi:transcriptional pleiotropic regulator of transition state genes
MVKSNCIIKGEEKLMKATGIVRPVDRMGRVVIPKEIRNQLDIKNDVDSFEIYMEEDKVVLKKHKPACFFCDNDQNIIEFSGYNICSDCIEKLNTAKNIKQNI